jgi:RES domain
MIGPSVFGFAGYVTVPPPGDGFWRVSSWPQVFDPPQPPPPLGSSSEEEDDGHRYDDPDGRFRTLYCATEPEGALGECLGDFVLSTAAVVHIEAFLRSEPEPGFDEDYHHPLRADDIKAFGWKLGHAPARDARLIDVDHWRTYLAAAPHALPALGRYGINRFDRRMLLDERRYITRTLGGIYRADAADEYGELLASGLRFTSRLPPSWECWALWEPVPLEETAAQIEDVTFNTPALRTAADMLGVALAP